MLIFRQMFDPASSTYTYLLAENGYAVLIDPVFEQVRRDGALIEELGLELVATLETHIHADHVTGAWLLKQRLGSNIVVSKAGGADGADRYLKDGERISFGMRSLGVRATPGHTRGCMTFVLDGEEMAFTGDCLLIRGCGRTDFQEGDPGQMYRSVRDKIFSLPDECPLYPAHDYRGLTATSVAEERAFNPRLGDGLSEADFSLTMKNLRLAHPKQIDVAVPANMKCGFVEGHAPMADPDWAPLTVTFSGVWEVDPQWVEENARAVQLLDVREPDEFVGPPRAHRGCGPDPTRNSAGPRRRTVEGQARRRDMPFRCALGASGEFPPAGGLHAPRQSSRRHDPLAAGRPCDRRGRLRARPFDLDTGGFRAGKGVKLLDTDTCGLHRRILEAGTCNAFGQGFGKIDMARFDDRADFSRDGFIVDHQFQPVLERCEILHREIDIDADGLTAPALMPMHADMGVHLQVADENMANGTRRVGDAQGLDVGHALSNCGRQDADDRPSPMKPPNELAAAKWTGENGYARMMIRDLETHIRLGVHAHERIPDKPQRIIVNVEMFADGKSHLEGEGLASVIDYDPIHAAIAGVEEDPHVLLIETLLEELIALCFRDERVRACKVSIVKPDIYDAGRGGRRNFRVRA